MSVIDLASATKVKDIPVGPHLSHPEGIAVDPRANRAYVAVTHQDLVAVLDTELARRRAHAVRGAPRGDRHSAGRASRSRATGASCSPRTRARTRVAVFALPNARGRTCRNEARREDARASRPAPRRSSSTRAAAGSSWRSLRQEEAAELYGEESEERGRGGQAQAPGAAAPEGLAARRPHPGGLVSGRCGRDSRPQEARLAHRQGARRRAEPERPATRYSPNDSDDAASTSFQYLPVARDGHERASCASRPTRSCGSLTPRAVSPAAPDQRAGAAGRHPDRARRPKIDHVFYIVRENRTYDQILGDDPRGDGDPKLTLFGEKITPNAHALARRFPLLDHVYANSEASIDGHFWTSAAAVSDYVVEELAPELRAAAAGRTTSASTRSPGPRSASSSTRPRSRGSRTSTSARRSRAWCRCSPTRTARPQELRGDRQEVREVGPRCSGSPGALLPQRRLLGRGEPCSPGRRSTTRRCRGRPAARRESRFDCFRTSFTAAARDQTRFRPSTTSRSPNDHTAGTAPGPPHPERDDRRQRLRARPDRRR